MSVDVDFLVEDLIESVKQRSFAPISQNTFDDAGLVTILNEELLRVTAKIIKQREDFFLSRKTVALVKSKDHYLIPEHAAGNALKAVFWVDSGGSKRLLKRRDVDRINEYSTANGDSAEYYFEGDQIVLMQPPIDSSASLLFVFSRRPNRLTLTENCAKITSVSSDTVHSTFTVSTDLTASLSVGSKVDFVRATSPFQLWVDSVSITAITTTTIQVLKSDVADVDGSVEPAATDYITPTGYTNIPTLPIEFHPVLAQRGACRLIQALGHLDKYSAMRAELAELESEALSLIRNRVESSPERPSKKYGLLRTFRW